MSFASIAQPFITVGIPVFPLVPGGKVPPKDLHFLQEATTDAAKIEAWDRENPDYNVALLANGEFCFLEFDIKGGMKGAAKEMGQEMPRTRTQRSGRGFGHYIFRHTERSRSLGNRSVNLPGGEEWFSFRADNKYLVGAGSLHPSGSYYKTVADVDPIPVPDWVCEFVEKHSESTKPKPTTGAIPVSADFDFDDFCDHFGITISHVKDDVWHVVEECPGVGYRHEQSTLTAFYYDGETLGWSCFAQGCPLHATSIGKVIEFLNDQKGEHYRGPIWPKQSDADFAEEFGVVFTENPTQPETDSTPPSFLAKIREGNDLVEDILSGKIPIPADDVDPPIAAEATVPEATASAEAPANAASDANTLDFPEDALYGRLDKLAKAMHMPLGLAYPALLACYSALPVADYMAGARVNLYVALIAPPGGGKNVAIKRALESVHLKWRQDNVKFTAGGERIPGPKRMLIVNNEMTEVLKKTGIDSSALAPRMCDFYDDGQFEKVVNGNRVTVDCRLSWLGGIPASQDRPDRFRELFSSESNYRLYERFLFGYSDAKFNYKPWSPPDPRTPESGLSLEDAILQSQDGVTMVVEIAPEADALCREWLARREGEGTEERRLEHMLLKVSALSASANAEETVSAQCLNAAIKFMDWQAILKRIFKSGEAKTQEAEFDAMALEAIRQQNEKTGSFCNWKRLTHDRKWGDKYGDSNILRWVDGLISSTRLLCPVVKNPDPDKKPERKKWLVMTRDYAIKSGRVSLPPEE